MTDASNSISPEGRAAAEAELRHLREVRRAEIVAAIKSAREFGDLSENAEYHAAREEQSLNEARIRTLEHHLANAEVVEDAETEGTAIPGSRVTYRDLEQQSETEITLVHPLEASVPESKISVESPVGEALLGAREGDRVTLTTPRGKRELEVVSIA